MANEYTLFFLDFGDQSGWSADTVHPKTFEIEGVGIAAHNHRTPEELGAATPKTGFGQFDHFQFTLRRVTAGMGTLLQSMCNGKVYPTVHIYCCNTSNQQTEDNFVITLTNASLTSYSMQLVKPDAGEDFYTFSIGYSEVQFNMTVPNIVQTGVNLAAHTVIS
jgi:type VI protein secretion system component Hcp